MSICPYIPEGSVHLQLLDDRRPAGSVSDVDSAASRLNPCLALCPGHHVPRGARGERRRDRAKC